MLSNFRTGKINETITHRFTVKINIQINQILMFHIKIKDNRKAPDTKKKGKRIQNKHISKIAQQCKKQLKWLS